MAACWTYIDEVVGRVSPELAPGPRGSSKNRDQVYRHTIAGELDWVKKLGLTRNEAALTDPAEHRAHRSAFVAAIRAFHADGKMARTWPLRYLIRHTAYHTLDHAWEMEDKDLERKLIARRDFTFKQHDDRRFYPVADVNLVSAVLVAWRRMA